MIYIFLYHIRSMINRMGTKFLQETLNDQLGKHIKDKLPNIKSTLEHTIKELKQELGNLGFDNKTNETKLRLFFR